MNIKDIIQHKLAEIIQSTYQIEDPNETRKVQLEIQKNKSDFEGKKFKYSYQYIFNYNNSSRTNSNK